MQKIRQHELDMIYSRTNFKPMLRTRQSGFIMITVFFFLPGLLFAQEPMLNLNKPEREAWFTMGTQWQYKPTNENYKSGILLYFCSNKDAVRIINTQFI